MSLLYKALKRASDQDRQKQPPKPPNLMPSGSAASKNNPLLSPPWLAGGGALILAAVALAVFWPRSEVILPAPRVAEVERPAPPKTARPDVTPAPRAVRPEPAAAPATPATPEKVVADRPVPAAAASAPAPVRRAAVEPPPAAAGNVETPRAEASPPATPAPRRPAARAAAPKVGDTMAVTNETAYFAQRHAEARDHLRDGRSQLALTVYDDLLGRQPTDLTALMGRAAALRRLGRNSDSIRAYEEVLNRYPNEIVALTELLGLLGQQSPASALKRLHRLNRVNPGHGPVAAQIALLYAQVGNLQEGIRYMTEATEFEPGNAAYRLNLAVLLDRAGDASAALRAYQAALGMAPSAGNVDIPVDVVRRRIEYLRQK